MADKTTSLNAKAGVRTNQLGKLFLLKITEDGQRFEQCRLMSASSSALATTKAIDEVYKPSYRVYNPILSLKEIY